MVFASLFAISAAVYARMSDAAVPMITAGTYNVRSQRWDGEKREMPDWSARKDYVKAYIDAQRPDILGMQEVIAKNPETKRDSPQRDNVTAFMDKLGYAGYTGTASNSDPIFWQTSKFTKINGDEILIYDTAKSKMKIPPASRYLTYTRLKLTQFDKKFLIFNYHFNQFEKESEQLDDLDRVIARIVEKNKQDTIIFTGDFNRYHDKVIKTLKNNKITLQVADRDTGIDHVLTERAVQTLRWDTTGPGKPPASDHPLVTVKLSL